METCLNQQQTDFLTACDDALSDGSFRRAVLNARNEKDTRAIFELVQGGKKQMVRLTGTTGTGLETLTIDETRKRMRTSPLSPFRTGLLSTPEFDLHYTENRKQVPRLYKSKPTIRGEAPAHNRPKNYVLREDRPYLKHLGVSNEKGQVNKKHHPKFRQIANFVEIIDRDIGGFVSEKETSISILDLGCGKGYLTFATHDYVRSRAKSEPQTIGIDIKPNVIDLCNTIARNLEFDGLQFRNARIRPTEPEPVDILIALHACDTATDDALALGVRSGMSHFFCAPCCQAQIAQQISPTGTGFDLINDFPLMKRKQADIITDICRAYLLTALGYEVKFLEFTPLEHTPKNIMLAGRKSENVDRAKALADYRKLKADTGFKRHALEENLKDLLAATD